VAWLSEPTQRHPPALRKTGGVEESVAEIGFGADGGTDDRRGGGDALELLRSCMGGVHQAPVAGWSNPESSKSSDGTPSRFLPAGLYFRAVARRTCMLHRQRGIEAAQLQRRLAEVFQRHGAQNCGTRAPVRAPRLDGVDRRAAAGWRAGKTSVSMAKRACSRFSGLPAEITGLVQRRQKGEANCRQSRRRLSMASPQGRFVAGIRSGVLLAVQIMEFPRPRCSPP